MLSFDAVEDVCERKRTTLVVHPAIRRAIRGYEESFYIGLSCYLRGETDGLYFLPLRVGGFVRLAFRKLVSPGGHRILRVDALTPDGLARIKRDIA